MKTSYYPKRIIFLFIFGFSFTSISSYYLYNYISLFYSRHLDNIASSFALIVNKKISTQVNDYSNSTTKLSNIIYSFEKDTLESNYTELIELTKIFISIKPEILSINIFLEGGEPYSFIKPSFIQVKKNFMGEIKERLIINDSLFDKKYSYSFFPFQNTCITTPSFNPEYQLATIKFLKAVYVPYEAKQNLLAYIEIEVPLIYINQFLAKSLRSANGYVAIIGDDTSLVLGEESIEDINIFSIFPLLREKFKETKSNFVEYKNFLIYSYDLSIGGIPFPAKIYIFLSTQRFIYSYFNLLSFFLANIFILLLVLTGSLTFFFWSLKQSKNQEKEFQNIEEEADKDPLTDAYTRSRVVKYLDKLQKDYNKLGQGFCCILFDIDFFKSINDNYGHDKGDYVLKNIAYLIQIKIRSEDLFARVGGEEFLIILNKINVEDAFAKSEKLRKLIEKHIFPFIKKPITISLGCAYVPYDIPKNNLIQNIKEIQDIADKALYFSKRNGRNQTTLTIVSPKSLK